MITTRTFRKFHMLQLSTDPCTNDPGKGVTTHD